MDGRALCPAAGAACAPCCMGWGRTLPCYALRGAAWLASLTPAAMPGPGDSCAWQRCAMCVVAVLGVAAARVAPTVLAGTPISIGGPSLWLSLSLVGPELTRVRRAGRCGSRRTGGP